MSEPMTPLAGEPGPGGAFSGPARLTNSQRTVSKATYAPAQLPASAPQAEPRRVMEKAAFIRRLGLTAAEYAALRQGSTAAAPVRPETVDLVARVTAAVRSGGVDAVAEQLATTSKRDLLAVGRAVRALRAGAGDSDVAARTAALVAAFSAASDHVVGALHLERMEMTPVGVEHGELVHSVPMTPKETVNISHREWSVTSQTFETIVTDSFEGFSETGVTDKTDITQATENETKHSTSLDVNGSITATVSGAAYSVTAAAATDYSDKNEVHNTAKQSIAHAVEVTRHASARTRKEHKTSFRVTSVAGAEDLAVRTLTNPNDYPIRVDYFQLIRKWQVDLIRYGLRLTYDLVIPDPGIDLIGPVLELQQIDQMLTTATLSFDLAPADIEPYDSNSETYYVRLAARYGAAVDQPPAAQAQMSETKALDKVGGDFHFDHIDMTVLDGYEIVGGRLTVRAHISGQNNEMQFIFDDDHKAQFDLYADVDLAQITTPATYLHMSGPVTFPYAWTYVDTGQVAIWLSLAPTKAAVEAWRVKVWAALREAAQAEFDRTQTTLKDRKAFLEEQLAGFDALTLRKMEHEEVMKWVLQWLLYDDPITANPIRDLAVDWIRPPAPERPGSTVALFRLVDFGKNSYGRDHFYTDSATERDSAITDYYYHDEGVAGFVYPDEAAGTVPLYRFRDTTNGHRIYTISNAERDDLNTDPDRKFAYEGVTCHVYPAAAEGTVPLHRLHNTSSGDRLYTVSDQERATALASGDYLDEGDTGHIYPPDPAPPAQDAEGVEGADPGVLDAETRARVLAYGSKTIEFLQNAVEWENMLFFVYPYFWDDVENWPFKRFLVHPDPVHREFLRGGAARVVLTIRPGFEDAFIRLAEGLKPDADSPYVTLGQEVRNYAQTNYESIPPANPDRTARPLLYPLQRAAWNDMQAIIAAVEYYNQTQQPNAYPSGTPGAPTLPGVLKTFLLAQTQTNADGSQTWAARVWDDLKRVPVKPGTNYADPGTPVDTTAQFIDPWGNPYHYATSAPPPAKPLLHGDYELICYGSNNKPETDPNDPLSEKITSWAEGLLVARWYEYTPTSALDVSVDTTLGINDTLGG